MNRSILSNSSIPNSTTPSIVWSKHLHSSTTPTIVWSYNLKSIANSQECAILQVDDKSMQLQQTTFSMTSYNLNNNDALSITGDRVTCGREANLQWSYAISDIHQVRGSQKLQCKELYCNSPQWRSTTTAAPISCEQLPSTTPTIVWNKNRERPLILLYSPQWRSTTTAAPISCNFLQRRLQSLETSLQRTQIPGVQQVCNDIKLCKPEQGPKTPCKIPGVDYQEPLSKNIQYILHLQPFKVPSTINMCRRQECVVICGWAETDDRQTFWPQNHSNSRQQQLTLVSVTRLTSIVKSIKATLLTNKTTAR